MYLKVSPIENLQTFVHDMKILEVQIKEVNFPDAPLEKKSDKNFKNQKDNFENVRDISFGIRLIGRHVGKLFGKYFIFYYSQAK